MQIFGRVHSASCIDFAERRKRSWSSRSNLRSGTVECVERNAARSSAWQALHISLTFSRLLDAKPAWHIAAHRANFWATAICKLQLILRSRLSSQGVAGFAPDPNF